MASSGREPRRCEAYSLINPTSLLRRSAAVWTPVETVGDIEGRVDAATLAPYLAAALSTLNVGEQDVVSLCDLADFSYPEAAADLGIPTGTVKSRLSRAHRKLRERLGSAAAAMGLLADDSFQEVQ